MDFGYGSCRPRRKPKYDGRPKNHRPQKKQKFSKLFQCGFIILQISVKFLLMHTDQQANSPDVIKDIHLKVVRAVKDAALKEIAEEDRPRNRTIGPALDAFRRFHVSDLTLGHQLTRLAREAEAASKPLISDTRDEEMAYRQAVREEVYPQLDDKLKAALAKEAQKDKERMTQATMSGGFAFGIESLPDRLLSNLLLVVSESLKG